MTTTASVFRTAVGFLAFVLGFSALGQSAPVIQHLLLVVVGWWYLAPAKTKTPTKAAK